MLNVVLVREAVGKARNAGSIPEFIDNQWVFTTLANVEFVALFMCTPVQSVLCNIQF